ncbi:clavesin-2-like [Daktulosphaira vitifoliae]|uniref:clavesin-2-like n=1 Tax=Daktulosphaira vitifoliae TaxID=58002 RepID=UPI0021AA82F8|nr:clavesin-2-like [Daktulosphaira vitifoliae]
MILEKPTESQMKYLKTLNFYQNESKMEEDVDIIIDWLSKQPHLPNVTDRVWLKHFHIACKNNLLKTKNLLDSYFVIRAELPELFDDLTTDAKWVENAMRIGKISLMPKLTPEGDRIQIFRTVENNSEFDPQAMFKGSLKTIDYLMRREPIYSMIIIIDCQHFRLSYLLSFTPSLTAMLVRSIKDATPLRIKGLHYVNPPKFITQLVTVFKIFLPAKVQKRIMVHESYSDLHKYVPKEVLPEEYGGEEESIIKLEEELIRKFKEDDEFWKTRPQADLSKRVIQQKPNELDMQGTFRKLTID